VAYSYIWGVFVFGDAVSLYGVSGTVLVVMGVTLVTACQPRAGDSSKQDVEGDVVPHGSPRSDSSQRNS